MEIYIIDGRYTEIAWYITAHNTQVEICSQYLTIGASMGIEWEHSLTVGYWIYLVYIPWGKWLWWNHLAAQMDLATASSGVFNQKATTKTRISRSNSKEILHDSSVILNVCQRQLKVLKAYRSCCSWCLPIFTPSQRQEETLILPIAINTSAPWRTARWARWAPWRSRRRQRHWSSWCSAECDHFSGKCHWVSILGIEQPRDEVSEIVLQTPRQDPHISLEPRKPPIYWLFHSWRLFGYIALLPPMLAYQPLKTLALLAAYTSVHCKIWWQRGVHRSAKTKKTGWKTEGKKKSRGSRIHQNPMFFLENDRDSPVDHW